MRSEVSIACIFNFLVKVLSDRYCIYQGRAGWVWNMASRGLVGTPHSFASSTEVHFIYSNSHVDTTILKTALSYPWVAM